MPGWSSAGNGGWSGALPSRSRQLSERPGKQAQPVTFAVLGFFDRDGALRYNEVNNFAPWAVCCRGELAAHGRLHRVLSSGAQRRAAARLLRVRATGSPRGAVRRYRPPAYAWPIGCSATRPTPSTPSRKASSRHSPIWPVSRAQSSFKTWLLRVVSNAALDLGRQRGRHETVEPPRLRQRTGRPIGSRATSRLAAWSGPTCGGCSTRRWRRCPGAAADLRAARRRRAELPRGRRSPRHSSSGR